MNDLKACSYHQHPDDDEDQSAAVAFLSTCDRSDYTQRFQSITMQFNISKGSVPSFYQMTKHRPNFLEHLLNFDEMEDEPESEEEAENNQPILEEAASNQPILVNQPVLVGKLEGGYEAGLKIMLEKTSKKRKYDEVIEGNEELIVINSYDGAEHSKNHKSQTSLISFSSQIFNEKII